MCVYRCGDDTVMQMEQARIAIPFAKFSVEEQVNPEFTLCKVYVCSAGRNRNYSYIGRETIENALPSLNYVPVVGHLMAKYDANGCEIGKYFGGHDYEVDDNLEVKSLTVPFGVVKADSFAWEDIDEYGKTVSYLTCEAYMWTGRYPELQEAIYNDDIWFNQSMEVNQIQYRPWEEDSNYMEFLSFNFSALCILGKSDEDEYHTEPCYINASISPVCFELDNNFAEMMGEMKESLSHCFDNNINQKGGDHLTLEERNAVFAELDLDAGDVDFDITDDMTKDELAAKCRELLAKMAEQDAAEEAVETPAAEEVVECAAEVADEQHEAEAALDEDVVAEVECVADEQEIEASFSMLYSNKCKKLHECIDSLCGAEHDELGNIICEVYVYMNDFDDEYVYYNVVRFTNDERAEANMRCGYTMSDDGSITLGAAEHVTLCWLTDDEVAKMEADKQQLATLIQFKADAERVAYEAQVTSLMDEFSDLNGLDEYEAIKAEAMASDVHDTSVFELRLFALRGKQVKTNKVQTQTSIKVGIDSDGVSDDDVYGGLLSRVRNRR